MRFVSLLALLCLVACESTPPTVSPHPVDEQRAGLKIGWPDQPQYDRVCVVPGAGVEDVQLTGARGEETLTWSGGGQTWSTRIQGRNHCVYLLDVVAEAPRTATRLHFKVRGSQAAGDWTPAEGPKHGIGLPSPNGGFPGLLLEADGTVWFLNQGDPELGSLGIEFD